PTSSAGSPSGAGAAPTSAGSGGSPSATPANNAASTDEGGCGIAPGTRSGASLIVALGLLFGLGRRRRRAV
ncbi:MAG TPA: MYXO-CTERM sorting domain-containing protein, partial [Polyangiaceae bacterium]|nr:MYXO-CTERM sorting domain-containing protein [Polyangiaceae bacterium]